MCSPTRPLWMWQAWTKEWRLKTRRWHQQQLPTPVALYSNPPTTTLTTATSPCSISEQQPSFHTYPKPSPTLFFLPPPSSISSTTHHQHKHTSMQNHPRFKHLTFVGVINNNRTLCKQPSDRWGRKMNEHLSNDECQLSVLNRSVCQSAVHCHRCQLTKMFASEQFIVTCARTSLHSKKHSRLCNVKKYFIPKAMKTIVNITLTASIFMYLYVHF